MLGGTCCPVNRQQYRIFLICIISYKQMKKIVFTVIVGLMMMTSCYRDEIDNLQSQIDQIRNSQLASVSQQIAAIQSTVNELLATNSELDGYIRELRDRDAELEMAISGAGSDIEELRMLLDEARQESSGRISDLLSQLEELQSQLDNAQGAGSAQVEEILNKIEELESELSGAGGGSAAELANLAALIEELRSAMESEHKGLRGTIDSLESENASLGLRISALEEYVDENLLDMDTSMENLTEWMEATLSTIAQYDSTVSQVASIKTEIEALNESMEQMEMRIKEEFSAEIDEAVAALGVEMEERLSSTVSEIVASYTSAIEEARSGIEAAYEASIAQAISNLEASMHEWVNGQLAGYLSLAQAQEELDALKSELEQQITASQIYLENMINGVQSALSEAISNNSAMIEALQLQLGSGAVADPELVEQILSNSEKIGENASAIAANSQMIEENNRLVAANTEMIAANAAAIEELRSSIGSEHQLILANAELIAENTENIAANAGLIAANAQQIEINTQQIAANAAEIEELRQALESTKSEITEEYQAAIASAMSGIDSRLDEFEASLSAIESSVQSSLADYESRVSAMEAELEKIMSDVNDIKNAIYDINLSIDEIREQIAAIMSRIQSISYVPQYADGNAVMTYTGSGGVITPGTAVMDFEIRPSSIASEIAAVWQEAVSVKAVYTLTRAVEFVELTVVAVEASPDGILTVTFSGDGLDESFYRSEISVSAALVISDGNNELASDYINVVPQTTEDIGGFSLLFENGLNIGCSAGETIRIPFTIVGWNDETVVDCMGNDGWEASVELFDDGHGYIVVVAPEPLVDGKVIVFADNGAGQASIKSLNFEEGRMILVSDTYYVDADGGLIDINIATNRIYDVYIPEDARGWVTLVSETKSSLRNDVVTLMIGKYAEGTVRTANVELRGIGVVYEYVTIVQEAFTEPVNIEFSDPLVKQILVESSSPRVDLNMDGEISSSEAAQCSFLPAFRETEITTFDELRYFTGLSSIGNYAFYDCESLTSIILPSGITYIGKEAFNGCINLSHISLPASISSLGTKAFYACRSLSSLGLPDNINEIGESAFAECSNLSIINIPKSLTSIEVNLFSGCKSLSNIELHENITSIGSGAFMGTGFTHFEWPENITTVSGSVFFDCDNLTEVVIPEGVAVISGNAFSDCENIKSLILPESLTAIGNNAFDHSGLTNIVLPENIKSISMFTFWGCEDLISVVLPEGIQNIGKQSFQDCTSLIDIVLPDNVESIGYSTFDGCASLREIVIPAKVNEIGEYAFRECVSLTEITFKGELPPKIEDNSFDFCSALQTIFVPVEGEENYRMILPDYKNLIKGY